MNDTEIRCLDTFPEWLRQLAADASALASVVGEASHPESIRRFATAGLNYLFKSLDLIPDGIEDLGYLDDAFVLRVASALALEEAPASREALPALAKLGADTALIAELLGDDYKRLVAYVRGLRVGTARGRTVDDVLGNEQTQREFLNEISGWTRSYEAPSFARDEKNLVKLRSFLSAKLPQI
jgi:uncharacterized membrane protein YkvA (DUF1232 family)